ncbi:MAG: glycosyltransferase family 39 protein [Lachnospiraceae bacterium]|nr:glycosyltransferase family 39 protein [Lachnospiraceae bacterium]
MNNIKKTAQILKENIVVTVFIVIMAVEYIRMMFTNKPWYDELYTYYYFISRGPIYAAIHWPVPNNHVGYSVISAVFDFFGNPYIGLRSVSCIAAVANLILIYQISTRFMNKYYATAATAMYAGAYLVYRLSVQGRGYTLATTCYLVAIFEIYHIGIGMNKKRNYIIFAAALALGMYIVPSSLYWVIPTCVTGGVYLLMKRYIDRLKRLIVAAVAAGAVTFAMYSIIWMAIGANLISKDAESAMFGVHQAVIALKHPFASISTGMKYMLATPYIQSIDRSVCFHTLPQYFSGLFGNFYSYSGIMLISLSVLLILWNAMNAMKQLYYKRTRVFVSVFVSVSLLVVPIMLIIQSVHPYQRVLSFLMIPISFGLMHILYSFFETYAVDKVKAVFGVFFMCIFLFVTFVKVFGSYYNEPFADRENKIEAVFAKIDTSKIDKMYYTDDYQKYVLKFYHDVVPEECENIEDCNYVMICPELRDSKYNEAKWPVLYSYHVARLKYVEEKMTELAEDEGYTIYARQ